MMEDEIEDLVGDVQLVPSESQKSVATSNIYSLDFTDSSSEKNNSSGKETYVIEVYDSDESDFYPVHQENTVIDLKEVKTIKEANVQYEVTNIIQNITRSTTTSQHNYIVAQEVFTQTSKTVFELAQAEHIAKQTLETQTSLISITERKAFEYKLQVPDTNSNIAKPLPDYQYIQILSDTLENESSKFPASAYGSNSEDSASHDNSEDRIINILDTESKEKALTEEIQDVQYENTSNYEESIPSDIEQDSLMEDNHDKYKHTRKKYDEVDCEIEELFKKLSGKYEVHSNEKSENRRRKRVLTPLTEESTIRRESLIELASDLVKDIEISNTNILHDDEDKLSPKDDSVVHLRLPPIHNQRHANNPQINFLFTMHPANNFNNVASLPGLYNCAQKEKWMVESKNLASGERPLLVNDGVTTNGNIHLPPIHIEAFVVNDISSTELMDKSIKDNHEPISIRDKIRNLKISKSSKAKIISRSDSRSLSPNSGDFPEYSKLCEAAERGCETLCSELLRRLKSTSWVEVTETLEEIPNVLAKFWGVITENRIADLIRQVSSHIDSPRTQVCRVACNSLAVILKNTNYTKKPDFYEAITLLLTKTGSFSRPVRRAANVALDEIVCSVDLSHSVTALSVHGVEHKSPLVRCAAARLLVVSCAMCGGGRGLLRARPPTAAAARRHTLRALAALLEDRDTHTRKYAERLYAMLRPLSNFEAYYLTDVSVELATRQMKKYDRLLCGPSKATT